MTRRVLRDFPNLKVGGGLLPDPDLPRKGETIYEMQEWTVVIVFPCGQGQGKQVIQPNPVFNLPPQEGDCA